MNPRERIERRVKQVQALHALGITDGPLVESLITLADREERLREETIQQQVDNRLRFERWFLEKHPNLEFDVNNSLHPSEDSNPQDQNS